MSNAEQWIAPASQQRLADSASGKCFTSDLSGQEFYKLLRLGFLPTAFAFGTCVYHVAHQGALQSLRQLGRNVEMPQYTQAVYEARELSMSRMQAEGGTVWRHGCRRSSSHPPQPCVG